MTAYLAPQFDTQFFDGSNVAAGYKLYTYDSGTTTPKAVYSDQAGTVPHTNPIVLDANGRVAGQMFLGSGEYTFTLKTDADVLVKTWNDVAGSGTANEAAAYDSAIRADLASTSDASKGAGMVGFIQSGSGAVARTLNDKAKEHVSVKDFGALGNGTTDDTAAIQAAVTALAATGGTLFFPSGNYKLTAPINWSPRVNLLGIGGHVGSRIFGTHAGNLFQYENIDFCIVERLAFDGAGCIAFRQTGVGGNYTQNVTWADCHFYGQLSECIYGNLIFAKIFNNTFGYYGTVGAHHRHIVSLGTTTNATNSNVIRGNRFYYAKGDECVRFDSGTDLLITENNFEQNTALPIRLNGIFNAKITDNFFEANSVASSEIEINVGAHVIDSTPTEISRNNFVPAGSIANIVQINNLLAKVYFNLNTGNLTGKNISNNASKVYSQVGNSFTGLTPPGYLTQETGTFNLTDMSGAGLSLAGGAGSYTRNGDVVTFAVSVTYPVTVNADNAKLGGLPYEASAITALSSLDNSGAAVTFATDAAAATMSPYLDGTLTPRTNAQLSEKVIYIAGSYKV